ncbi:hypothetical protein [Nostoc sp. 'Lobaria pulmonaria (5183) cyanobiont']|uniref:hypothetical protein n=1 Tax=Nostoc sp. 'Lobaria pulmonaria (5183) cyanobiont' TaxID=1618022 RepID=UPI00131A05EB|nr:hypothetical protein [Nostoc sp. 'Lobaria pulmonaria (5183) cyanobiont']
MTFDFPVRVASRREGADSLKANVTEQGEKLLGGKHIQGKLMSKVVNLLFQELCKIIPLT